MAAFWAGFMELLQVGIFTLVQFYGGQLGPAIVTFGLLARLALLPLTLRLSLRSRAQAQILKGIQPAVQRVRDRWKDDPERIAKETMAVYEREGVRPLDPTVVKGSLIQAPLYMGLFQSIRAVVAGSGGRQSFLWIGNLAKPDPVLALIVCGLVGTGVLANVSGSGSNPRFLLLISCIGTFLMLVRLSSGFGLYMGASAVVSTLQGLLIRSRESRALSGAPT